MEFPKIYMFKRKAVETDTALEIIENIWDLHSKYPACDSHVNSSTKNMYFISNQ